MGHLAVCPKCSKKFRIQALGGVGGGNPTPSYGEEEVEGAGQPMGMGSVPGPMPGPMSSSALALWALFLGVFGIFIPPLILGALVLGILACVKINRSGGMLSGRGKAVAGIVLAVIGCLLWLGIAWNFQKIRSYFKGEESGGDPSVASVEGGDEKENTVTADGEVEIQVSDGSTTVSSSDSDADHQCPECYKNLMRIRTELESYAKQDANGCLPRSLSDVTALKKAGLKCSGADEEVQREYELQPNVSGKVLSELRNSSRIPLVICCCHPDFDRVLYSDGTIADEPIQQYMDLLDRYNGGMINTYQEALEMFLPKKAFWPTQEWFKSYKEIDYGSLQSPVLLWRCRTSVDGYPAVAVVQQRDEAFLYPYCVVFLLYYRREWKIGVPLFFEEKQVEETFDFIDESPLKQSPIIKDVLDNAAMDYRAGNSRRK